MKGHGAKMPLKGDEAIAALLECPSLAEAAKKVGIAEVTLWRWLQDPDFKARYREARQQVVQHAIGALQRATAEAVTTLTRNLKCGTASVEVQAARTILEQALRAAELDDLLARVDDLERAITARDNSVGGREVQ